MIDSYRFGAMVVDGVTFPHDVIVLPTRVIPWRRVEGHLVSVPDLAQALLERPAVIVIGTGMVGRMRVAHAVMDLLEAEGIKAVVARTGSAWKAFNECLAAGEAVAGAFHLTC